MARRRRKKGNPLLTKIVVISVLAHVIILPVAAHFGAFKKLQREFGTSKVVMVSLPPVEAEKPKAAPKAEKKTAVAKKTPGSAPKAASAQRAGLPQPKVVASAAIGDEGGGGATVDANATGVAGKLPTGTGGGAVPPPAEKPAPPPAPEPKKTEPVAPPEKPVVPPTEPKKPDPVVPKPWRIVETVAIESPQPTIPDDLRAEPLDKTLIVEADVDTGGHPTNVTVAESTGIKELDAVGVDTAKRYRFKPATVDDAPVDQHVRFRILFKVE